MVNEQQLVQAYSEWVENRFAVGFEGHILTFMFKPMPGSVTAREREMYAVIERTFGKLLTRVTRDPANANWDKLPLWLGCTDWPIPKWEKDYFSNIAINDGQHIHVVALAPPSSRLRRQGVELGDHIADNQKLYLQSEPYLDRIHDRKIDVSPGRVTSYVLKSIKLGRSTQDAIIILPRAKSEII